MGVHLTNQYNIDVFVLIVSSGNIIIVISMCSVYHKNKYITYSLFIYYF